MGDFGQLLRDEIETVHTVDPHCHLRPGRPEARTLADILLYHHVWIELVSAGMPIKAATKAGMPHETADPGMEPIDRLKAALPYLPLISTTTCGNMLRVLLRDLYGVPDGILTADNLADAYTLVESRNSQTTWRNELLGDKCRITRCLTVEGGDEPNDSFVGRGIEGLPSVVQDARRTQLDMFGHVEFQLGTEIRTAEDYSSAMYKLGRERANADIHFVGIWTLPYFTLTDASDSAVNGVIADLKDGKAVSNEQQSIFWSRGIRSFLQGMRKGSLRTIQFIVGAEVLPPHRSLTQWSSEFVGTLGRLAGEFEDFHFNCSSAADANIQDLGIVAKHVPNVSVAGYWWHVLYPFYIRKSIETRLDMVPSNKIVAFFSDAYHAEWIYPKLKLVKQIWAEVLEDRVHRGLLTEDAALSLVKQIFHDNPSRIYGVK